MFWTGCQPAEKSGGRDIICPGKASIQEAIRTLSLQRQNLQPFLAGTDCTISYPDEDGKTRHEPVRNGHIAFVPDTKFDFIGKLLFKELRFGTNEAEVWLRIKADLKEFGDSYWWAKREDVKRCPEMLPVNPDNLAEALGVVNITPEWKLSHRDGYDLLTLVQNGRICKRVSVNTCNYYIEEIDYFDTEGLKRASVQLKDYSTGDSGILVPMQIKIASYDRMGVSDLAISFELKNMIPLPLEKRGKKLFVRPERDGFEHMYRLNDNCEFIEE